MTNAMIRRHESERKRKQKTMKRRVKRFLQKNMARIVLIGLPLIGMIAGFLLGVKTTTYAQSVKKNDYGRQIVYKPYTVKEGDTVWGIAQDLAALNPEYNDIRQYVADIERTNRIGDGGIKSGQVILIPYYINMNGKVDRDEIYQKYGIGD